MGLHSATVERAILRLEPVDPARPRARAASVDAAWFFHLARSSAWRAPIPFCWGPHGSALLLGMIAAIVAAVLIAGSAFAADLPVGRAFVAPAPQPSFFQWLFGKHELSSGPARPVAKAKSKALIAAKPPVAVGVSQVGKSPAAIWLNTKVWPPLADDQRKAIIAALKGSAGVVVIRCQRLECRRLAQGLRSAFTDGAWVASIEFKPVSGVGIAISPASPAGAAAAKALASVGLETVMAGVDEGGKVVIAIGARTR